ncbi:gamma-glutamyl-gamma-aminobutyrate hydrolase family protein [Paradesulfitobacterium ferrireducens]|uniref:gamma-glutamyl-gamma-aminobutyrate hydrolase family protein n=1 Tax=Paradesulfitobacterium ferrireducens TaxID=2816476 RepID=UPI001A8E9454|nr:gamma-glutamyl-gamma-aminobutyrate hydrolase family protein [Paradesulfitobacterium ferrireducens]
MKPLIGINCVFEDINDIFNDKLAIAHIYIQAIEKMGGVPLLLPIVEKEDLIEMMIDQVDGLLMSGGGNLSTEFSDPSKLPGLAEQSPIRHRFDVRIAKLALERDMPVLGICRGHQTINEVAGGTLHHSITELTKHDHRQAIPDDRYSHQIKLEANSRLASLLGTKEIGVNSFHRQAVNNLAPGFRAAAWAADNILEAFESDKHTFVMGCQFHPESLMVSDARFANIYGAFVRAAAAYHERAH